MGAEPQPSHSALSISPRPVRQLVERRRHAENHAIFVVRRQSRRGDEFLGFYRERRRFEQFTALFRRHWEPTSCYPAASCSSNSLEGTWPTRRAASCERDSGSRVTSFAYRPLLRRHFLKPLRQHIQAPRPSFLVPAPHLIDWHVGVMERHVSAAVTSNPDTLVQTHASYRWTPNNSQRRPAPA